MINDHLRLTLLSYLMGKWPTSKDQIIAGPKCRWCHSTRFKNALYETPTWTVFFLLRLFLGKICFVYLAPVRAFYSARFPIRIFLPSISSFPITQKFVLRIRWGCVVIKPINVRKNKILWRLQIEWLLCLTFYLELELLIKHNPGLI